ncbi:Brix domain-containing protein 1-like protein [Harpegnathos saltator]|uniref:Ribosome production factor 2 homolog n=1 Tax=Harpegnathos saltator TaxID=610380 RepID=E2BMJ2_HARSA|nr:Brix domain-containing protein 1-like protein [Harpegnathos saltator]
MTLTNEKRLYNPVMRQTYKNKLLDMIKFGVKNYNNMQYFKQFAMTAEIKPLLIFLGELFKTDCAYIRIKDLFIDMFRREHVEEITLQGLEHILCFTACDHMIGINSFRMLLKKSDSHSKTPDIVEIVEVGPQVNLMPKFTRKEPDCEIPKASKIKKKKNISEDKLGTTYGSTRQSRKSR